MERSPCRGCIYEFQPKEECIHTCERIGKVQKQISYQVMVNRTRADYSHVNTHNFLFPA